MGIGEMIGAGIFVLTGIAAGEASVDLLRPLSPGPKIRHSALQQHQCLA